MAAAAIATSLMMLSKLTCLLLIQHTVIVYTLLYSTIGMNTPITILGCGAATHLLLLMFSSEDIPPQHITVIDPSFDGGDLQRSWACVRSNTHWRKLCESIESVNPAWKDKLGKWALSETVPLYVLIQTLREATQAYLQKCNLIYDTAICATYTNSWEVVCGKSSKVTSEMLFVCVGSEPKSLHLPIPTIPLSKALCAESLAQYIKPHEHVLVFGAQHSGTLVIDSLLKAGCAHISVVYRNEKGSPFLFARDGEYDGIKEESEIIADRLLKEKPPSVDFLHQSDFQSLARALRTADWVVYAIGFTQRTGCRIVSAGAPVQLEHYDAGTGKLPTVGGTAWGFGIAFPNRAPDGKHYDVSLHSFAQHILNQKTEILEKYASVISVKITNT